MNCTDRIKNDKVLLAIIIIVIMEVFTTLFRSDKYLLKYDRKICKFFHYDLSDFFYRNNMTEKSFDALSSISCAFPQYSDNINLGFYKDQGLTVLGIIFNAIFLIISYIYLYRGYKKYSMYFFIFSSLYCIVINSVGLNGNNSELTISLAITSVPEENIDNDTLNMELFEKTLKENLDYYYYGRITWLKIYSIITILECIIQMILVIKYNRRSNNKSANEKNIIKTSDISSHPSSQGII